MASGQHNNMSHSNGKMDLELGMVLKSRYVVEAMIGQGTSARVYRCRDTMLGNLFVAVKVYPPDIISDSLSAGRVNRELLSSHGIDHPNVARFYECIRTEEYIGMVMEYVPGRTLESMLVDGEEFTLFEVSHILHQIILGLAAIHSAGVLHRDLKPANIIITGNGVVKITDFGLAKRSAYSSEEGRSAATTSDDAVGTPMYLSPEYLEHGVCDYRSDVYALGTIAYELVTGEEPFRFTNMFQFVEAKINTTPTPPHHINKLCPPELGVLIMKMMANDPEERFQSAREVDQVFSLFRRRQRVTEASTTKLSNHSSQSYEESIALDEDDDTTTRGRRLYQPKPDMQDPNVLSGLGTFWEEVPQFFLRNMALIIVLFLFLVLGGIGLFTYSQGVDWENKLNETRRFLDG